MTDPAADPTAPGGPKPPRPPKRWRSHARRAHAVAWGWVAALSIMAVFLVFALALSEARLTLPDSVARAVETRVARALPQTRLEIGGIEVGLDRRAVPRVWITEAQLATDAGQQLAQIARIGLAFDPGAALRGRLAPRGLRVSGVTVTLRRDRQGAFQIAFGGGGVQLGGGLAGVLAALDAALDRAPLDRVDRVELEAATISVEDARTARVWQLTDAGARLARDAEGLGGTLSADIFNGTDSLGRVEISATALPEAGGATASLRLSNVQARDIALQSPALSFLGVLEAPLSGALRLSVDGEGALEDLAGTLDIGAGRLAPRAGAQPLSFDRAQAYFTFDPAAGRLRFSQVSADGALGSGTLTGHADLADIGPDGFPRALVAQMTVDALDLGAPELFDAPLSLSRGQIDMRLRLNPFVAEFGQIALPDMGGAPGRDLMLSGRAAPGADGWRVSVDGQAQSLGIDALLRLWPRPISPKARQWLVDNIQAATARNVDAALRYGPGDEKPQLNLTFVFDEARVRVMRDVPPVQDASGLGSIMDHRLVIDVAAGTLPVEGRGALDIAGSTFVIPDGRIKPSPAEIALRADGPLPALLAVLDGPRFNLLSRSGRDADLAQGQVSGTARIDLLLRKGNRPEDIDFAVDATLSDLTSDRIVPGRSLTADSLALTLEDMVLRAGGQATLDGVPFDGAWQLSLAGEDRGQGEVAGQVTLGPESLRRFGVSLPDGLLSGRTRADLAIDLAPGAPPRLRLASDLVGAGLSIGAVAWSKPAGTPADFDLTMDLGDTPRVEQLSLSAPGLSAQGRVRLAPGPRFEALELSRVRLGGWLDGAVTVTAQGQGEPPAIRVTGGEIDIRRANLGSGGGGSAAPRGPVSLRLDRLVVTDTLALNGFAMDLDPGRALAGGFRGALNGGVRVAGTLAGTARGPAIRVQANDAGAVLRDAGLFRDVRGGTMDLILRPTGQRGEYDGTLRVRGPQLRNAPALAELLSAVSVVGLLEQLNGQGIPFEEVSAEFRLSPSRITLYRSSATGNALGLSMDGLYDPRARVMDMQGVLSPVYLLNRVGEVFTRRGEGLFGVNFTLRGPVRDPSVGVNPLSIFTPGMFREIFRRAPPERPAARAN
ncbi:AsmA-like C-terminal region [Palleronia salina]|uniref:AsmA-like C-terminal region n=1 Tax=Palleronia salina TaxID=313368 RepID=A0A1M6BJ64_9RHOB|nr:DUF3971 domain-containing protein [Palleronia salina]SHI48726.1 AsmA-like C-terminal region [Palleronia salina]